MLWPQWYRNVGDEYPDGGHFEEYTDDRGVAEVNQEIYGGTLEEVGRPSSDVDLNQPQTWLGRMQTAAVNRGWLTGERPEEQ